MRSKLSVFLPDFLEHVHGLGLSYEHLTPRIGAVSLAASLFSPWEEIG